MIHPLMVASALLGLVPSSFADDAYWVKNVRDLTIVEGELPADDLSRGFRPWWNRFEVMHPYGALHITGEIYIETIGDDDVFPGGGGP